MFRLFIENLSEGEGFGIWFNFDQMQLKSHLDVSGFGVPFRCLRIEGDEWSIECMEDRPFDEYSSGRRVGSKIHWVLILTHIAWSVVHLDRLCTLLAEEKTKCRSHVGNTSNPNTYLPSWTKRKCRVKSTSQTNKKTPLIKTQEVFSVTLPLQAPTTQFQPKKPPKSTTHPSTPTLPPGDYGTSNNPFNCLAINPHSSLSTSSR